MRETRIASGLLGLFSLVGILSCGRGEPAPLEKATRLFQLAQWDAAIEACDKVIEVDPEHAGAWLIRGRSFLGKEMPERAVEDFTQAIRLQPENPEAYYHRAIAHRQLGKQELAYEDRERARALDPEAKKAGAMKYATFDDQQGDPNDDVRKDRWRHPANAKRNAAKDDDESDLTLVPWESEQTSNPMANDQLSQGVNDGASDGQWTPTTPIPKGLVAENGPLADKSHRTPKDVNEPFSAGERLQRERTLVLDSGWASNASGMRFGRSLAATAGRPRAEDRSLDRQDGPTDPPRSGVRDRRDSERGDAESGHDELHNELDGEDPETPRPTVPSGILFLPNYAASTATTERGYPYGGLETDAGRASGKYLSRMFSLPGRGLPSMPMHGAPASGSLTRQSPRHGSDVTQSVPVKPRSATGQSVPSAGTISWQYLVPFPQQDLPTTGVIQDYAQ